MTLEWKSWTWNVKLNLEWKSWTWNGIVEVGMEKLDLKWKGWT